MTTTRATADLCDEHGERVQVCEPVFRPYGGKHAFSGPVSTVRCFEDNTHVKEAVESPGGGRVLVVDGGGEGGRGVPVRVAGVTFRPGDYVYADEDGVVVSHSPLG